MSSIFQQNFRKANQELIRIASNPDYSAQKQGLLINKIRKEIENNFDVSGNKIYFSFWGIILLLPIITAITQTIGNVLFK